MFICIYVYIVLSWSFRQSLFPPFFLFARDLKASNCEGPGNLLSLSNINGLFMSE